MVTAASNMARQNPPHVQPADGRFWCSCPSYDTDVGAIRS